MASPTITGSARKPQPPCSTGSASVFRATAGRAFVSMRRPQQYNAPMRLKRAEDFDQELLNLFDQYVHGDIDRRGFLDRAARFAAGA